MSTTIRKVLYCCVGIWAVTTLTLQASESSKVDLNKNFDLAGSRTQKIHYYEMVTRIMKFSPGGKSISSEELRLKLMWTPAALAGTNGDQFKCIKLTMQTGSEPPVAFPELQGWSYALTHLDEGVDEKGQIFGIEHSKFENMKNSKGEPVTSETAYTLYNAFIDFHTFAHVYARKMSDGKVIDALKTIGQSLIHTSSHREAP